MFDDRTLKIIIAQNSFLKIEVCSEFIKNKDKKSEQNTQLSFIDF